MMVRGALAALAVFVVVTTFLPLVRSDAGWIRMWDFPRPQLAIASLAILVMIPLLRTWPTPVVIALTVGTTGAFAYNLVRVLPYTPLVATDVPNATRPDPDRCFSLMAVNVLQHNRDAQRLLKIIETQSPDILFIVETDDWWRDTLRPVIASYDTAVMEPRDNTYGLIFLTRLQPVEPVEIRHLISDVIPSIRARLQKPGGGSLTVYGLHPEPPTPFKSSEERDLELLRVAYEVKHADESAIVMGDLNDVAWSPTTRRFKEVADLKDPRVGRGLYATFHARVPIARWPLDHLFHTSDFKLLELKVLPDIGSDHFPVMSRLCVGD